MSVSRCRWAPAYGRMTGALERSELAEDGAQLLTGPEGVVLENPDDEYPA